MARGYDPLAPIPPKRLRQMARAYARAQFAPVLSQINAEYARRSQAGNAAILQGTQDLAAELGGAAGQTHQIYGQASAQQRADDAALANYLQQAGVSLGAAPAGVPGGSYGNLSQMGAGAAAAGAGIGSAALSRLIAEGAARENYAGNLPNIARLGGAQRARELGLQLESGRQKEASSLQAKIPGVVAQIEQDMANREFQKAAAELATTGGIQRAEISAAASRANTRQREKAKIDPKTGLPWTYEAKINPATGKPYRTAAGTKSTGFDEQLSSQIGYVVDHAGHKILFGPHHRPRAYRPGRHVGGKGKGSGGGQPH